METRKITGGDAANCHLAMEQVMIDFGRAPIIRGSTTKRFDHTTGGDADKLCQAAEQGQGWPRS